ncbi:MAG: hypothetical protein U1E76_10570 [Planctomycetota bacterium]
MTEPAIDFYVYNLHELIVWEPIWRQLRRAGAYASFVVEPPGVHTATGSVPDRARGYLDDKRENLVPLMTDQVYGEVVTWLLDHNLPFSTVGNYHADAVVSTQGTGWLWRYDGLKLRTMYGVGAVTDSYGHGPVNQGMHAVFVHGAFSAAAIREWVAPENVLVTGFPKYVPLFRGQLDRAQWQARFGLDQSRPTIVSLSTWAQHSAIDRFAGAIAGLAARHQVLYKPHHNNLCFEHERVDQLRRQPGVIVNERERSILPFLLVADLVLADVRSGAFTEAFLTDRRTIGLSPRGDPSQDRVIPQVAQAAALCWDPAALDEQVALALGQDRFAAGRRELAAHLFQDLGGRDDEVTAHALLEVVARLRSTPQRAST